MEKGIMYSRLPTSIHFELTDFCNAMCPMCDRVSIVDGELIESKLVTNSQLLFDDYFRVFGNHQINSVNYCGVLGDPIMAKDLMKFVKHFEDQGAGQRIHTNGGVRNKKFWKELAQVKNLFVIFGIDGLNKEDHELYRVGTKYEKVVENAKTFIDNGGNAIWQMLKFKHNEETLDEARQMSRKMGFKKFESRGTESRFKLSYDDKPVVYLSNAKEKILEQPTNKVYKQTLLHYDEVKDTKCFAKSTSEIFITASGDVYPCCYVGIDNRVDFTPDNIKDVSNLDDLIYSNFFEHMDKETKTNEVCKLVCGKV